MSFWTSKEDVSLNQVNLFQSMESDKNIYKIKCDNGFLKVVFYSKDIIRIIYSYNGEFLKVPSFSVIEKPDKNIEITSRDNKDYFVLESLELKIKFDKKCGEIILLDKNNSKITKIKKIIWSKTVESRFDTSFEFDSNLDNHFYGLGQKYGYLDKKGREYKMWNTDQTNQNPTKDPLYQSIPFMIVHNKLNSYGWFLDKTCATWFDLRNDDSYNIRANDFEMDFYFIGGFDIKEIIKKYTYLTGKINLPPIWSLGYQQCRWSYFSEKIVRDIANGFRKNEIPCDVIYLDIDYMDGYRVFTWNNNRFPNPKKLINDLNEMGFKVVTIIDPGVKKDPEYSIFKEGIEKDLFCKYLDNKIFYGKVWPEECAFPDFTNEKTSDWWADKHKELFDLGIAGIWNDMNEPSNFKSYNNSNDRETFTIRNDVMLENNGYNNAFSKYHNVYGNSMCKSTLKGFSKYLPNKRPFILSRAAYSGIQRYSALWTGDNTSWWEHLESSISMCLNIGLSGVSFVGSDVGGFHENADSEIFIRWIQLGTFIPFFRGHSEFSSKKHEPWEFGEKTLEIVKKYIQFRYKLLNYIYTEFYNSSITGLPIMKPLVLEYPSDDNLKNLFDQFMLGENLLVAPVTKPSLKKRLVYLPQGTWFDYRNNKSYEGKSYIVADTPIDSIPLFVKSGTILPLNPIMNYTNEKIVESLDLEIFPGDGEYQMYEDDGISFDYKLKKYNLIFFKTTTSRGNIEFKIIYKQKSFNNGRKNFILKFINVKKSPKNIYINNIKFNEFKHEQDILTIKVLDDSNEINIMF
ncbi:MAG: glycoside hydrolase family 31 protein [Clostridiales bacterium]